MLYFRTPNFNENFSEKPAVKPGATDELTNRDEIEPDNDE